MLRPCATLTGLSLKTTDWIFSNWSRHQLAYIHRFSEPNVRPTSPLLLVVALLSCLLAGCLTSTDDRGGISLNVNYEQTNGTLVHSYVDGTLQSSTNVTLSFDFSKTDAANQLTLFGIDLLDRQETVTVDARTESTVYVEFLSHGMYALDAFAIDEQGVRESTHIVVRMDLRIEWIETNTYEPKPLIIDPIPAHGGTSPDTILIHSTIENPELIENIESGREVEFTWSLVDGNEDACQVRNGLVHDGDFSDWETIHFNTFQVHELRVSYDSGQDYINVDQTVLIAYSPLESTPTTEEG